MEKFAHTHRPRNEICKEPQRKGRGKQISVRSALDALSAMRLASYYQKLPHLPGEPRLRRQGHRLVPSGQRDPVGLFSEIRLGHTAQVAEQTYFDSLTASARRLFLERFPFGETAENAPTLAQRQRITKSGSISL